MVWAYIIHRETGDALLAFGTVSFDQWRSLSIDEEPSQAEAFAGGAHFSVGQQYLGTIVACGGGQMQVSS